MFRPRLFLSILLVTAPLMICGGSVAASIRLPIACPSSSASCRPLSSVHSASTMVADGSGGAYLVWMDAELRVRLLRVSPDLTVAPSWPADGVVLAPELRGSHHVHPALAADGEGGVYVVWIEQDEALDMSLRLQRLRGDGRPEAGWPSAGVRLVGPSLYVWYPSVALLPGLGVAVAWTGLSSGIAAVRVLALDPHGHPVAHWPAEGLVLGLSATQLSDDIELAADNRGGMYAAWAQRAQNEFDLLVAYASPFGVQSGPWTVASDAVAWYGAILDSHPELAVEGREATVLWNDATRSDRVRALDFSDVLAQRLSSNGQMHWDPAIGNGHVIAAGPGEQFQPHLIRDGSGGTWFSWNEFGPFVPVGGRLTHLGADGRPAAGWQAGGIAMGMVSGLHSDLEGGALVTFFDGQTSMLQRVPRDWSPGASGLAAVSLGKEIHYDLRVCPDGHGGVFLAWEDRTSPGIDVAIEHFGAETLSQPLASQPAPAPAPPPAFAVHPIFPNPTSLECRIEFDLPARMPVDIEVFDVSGRRVARPAEGRVMEPGPGSISWSLQDGTGRHVPSGLYLVRLRSGTNHAVLRMAVTR